MDRRNPFIVIVDDVPENVRLLHHALKDEGYSFGIARDAGELFSIIRTHRPTLILLDVMLPDLDGFAVMDRLRADPRYADLAVIFVTARTEHEDRLRGFEAGGVDYIPKPFDAAEVRARVRTHVALRLALEEQQRLNAELRAAIDRVKILEGIIPICANCKKIRDDDGFWTAVESYISEHTSALFSHSLCPECAQELFPERDDHA